MGRCVDTLAVCGNSVGVAMELAGEWGAMLRMLQWTAERLDSGLAVVVLAWAAAGGGSLWHGWWGRAWCGWRAQAAVLLAMDRG